MLTIGKPILWVFAQIETLWPNVNRPEVLISNCERFHDEGIRGLALWDSDLSKPTIPSETAAGYQKLNTWALAHGWSLSAQVFPQGEQLSQRYQLPRSEIQKRVITSTFMPPGRRNQYSITDWLDSPDGVVTAGGDSILEKNGQYLCLADERVHPIYEKILKNVLEVFPKESPLIALHCYYDEIRQQGTHERCHKPGGELLAAHVKRTIEIIREGAPHLWPMLWNDMFDPNHNAVTPYKGFPVFGGWKGSWEGVDKDILILNWNTPNRSTSQEDSLKSVDFWAERGNPQIIASYYDGANGDGTTAAKELQFKREAQKRDKVVGQCYCTWPPHNNINRMTIGQYLTKDGWDTIGEPDKPVDPEDTDYDFLKGT